GYSGGAAEASGVCWSHSRNGPGRLAHQGSLHRSLTGNSTAFARGSSWGRTLVQLWMRTVAPDDRVWAIARARRLLMERDNGPGPLDADPHRRRLQYDGSHHPQSLEAAGVRECRRCVRRLDGARQAARQALRVGDLGLEHGTDDRL